MPFLWIRFRRPRTYPALAVPVLLAACAVAGGRDGAAPGPAPRVVTAEPIPLAAFVPQVDLDSLSAGLATRADTTHPSLLPLLELEIRDWLGRLEFGDPALLPPGRNAETWFRPFRGRLLDALGWSAYRRNDLRQAEAALVSAVEVVNSRGTTAGYARHYLHLGRVQAARGRWGPAAEAFLAAESRGAGAEATPELEAAYRRWRGSFRGLEARREAERARIEDERRQLLVASPGSDPLPAFLWPRRTGPAMAASELVGRPAVLVVWDERSTVWVAGLEDLARAVSRRGGAVVAVWLGAYPAGAGPPRPFPVLLPDDPAAARAALGVGEPPALLVVDYAGRIRYRHGGPGATPPRLEDVLLQIDHLERRRR